MTTTLYVPAIKLVAFESVCTGTVFHKKLYPGVPPDAIILAEPSLLPKHSTPLLSVLVITISVGWVIICVAESLH